MESAAAVIFLLELWNAAIVLLSDSTSIPLMVFIVLLITFVVSATAAPRFSASALTLEIILSVSRTVSFALSTTLPAFFTTSSALSTREFAFRIVVSALSIAVSRLEMVLFTWSIAVLTLDAAPLMVPTVEFTLSIVLPSLPLTPATSVVIESAF